MMQNRPDVDHMKIKTLENIISEKIGIINSMQDQLDKKKVTRSQTPDYNCLSPQQQKSHVNREIFSKEKH